ncbi:MAG: VWA domain-containing protein [Planctomycetota bacterium]
MKLIPRFDYELSPRGRTQKVVMLLRIMADAPPATHSRAPINLSLVIDRSGSMAGEKLERVKEAAHLVVNHLGPTDRLSVITYDDHIDTVVPSAPVVNKDEIHHRIDDITSRGCTNLSGGWQRGEAQVREHHRKDGVNRVMLLTDGLANAGVTAHEQLVGMSQAFREDNGVATTAIGVGEDFDEDLLRKLADAGGGNFFFIEKPDQAPAIFHEELGELLALVGQDLLLTIDFSPGVKLTELLNDYPVESRDDGHPENGGGRIVLRLGDAFGGEEKAIICELELPAVHDDGPMAVASAQLTFMEMQPAIARRELAVEVTRPVADPEACADQPRDDDVVAAAMRLTIARKQALAREQADAGDLRLASHTLMGTIRTISSMPAAMAGSFGAEMAEIQQTQSELEGGVYSKLARKQMMSRSHNAQRGKGRYKTLGRDNDENESDQD